MVRRLYSWCIWLILCIFCSILLYYTARKCWKFQSLIIFHSDAENLSLKIDFCFEFQKKWLHFKNHVFHFQGIYTLHPFISARTIKAGIEDIKILLTEENPFLSRFSNESRSQLNGMGKWAFLLTSTSSYLRFKIWFTLFI